MVLLKVGSCMAVIRYYGVSYLFSLNSGISNPNLDMSILLTSSHFANILSLQA